MFFAGVGTSAPSKRHTEKECWSALRRTPQFARLKPRSKATLQHVLLNESNGIRTRHLALERLEEVFETDPDTLDARFARHAPQLAAAAARSALRDADLQARDIDAVLVSTCIGYLCPGLTGYVSERIGLRSDILGLDLLGPGCAPAPPNLRAGETLTGAASCSATPSHRKCLRSPAGRPP